MTAQNKIKIIFKINFLFLLIIFIKNIEKFDYFASFNDGKSMTHREIMKVIHKINLNKIFKINEIINKALRQFVYVVIK